LLYILKVGMEYKIFVGGLTVQTTEEDLEEYFSTIGSITQTAVIKNKVTGLSKCYAFVHTNDVRTYQRIITSRHMLNGRIIDCKDGFNRHENPSLFEKLNSRKIFVGGLAPNTQDKHLEEYFQKYGPVFKAYVIMDPNTNRSKRFGFIIMETEDSVYRIMEQKVHIINGYSINCKRFDRSSIGETGTQWEGSSVPPGLTQLKDEYYQEGGHFRWSDYPNGEGEELTSHPAKQNTSMLVTMPSLILTPASKPYVPEGSSFPPNIFAQSEPDEEFLNDGPDEDDFDSSISEKISRMSSGFPSDAKNLHLRFSSSSSFSTSVYNIDNYSPASSFEELMPGMRFNFCTQKKVYEKCEKNFHKMNKLKTSGEIMFKLKERFPKEFVPNVGFAPPGF
jgi:RNA recognition motif-containing protein